MKKRQLNLIGMMLLIISACNAQIPVFNENWAFDYLKAQCAFGPRNPGSVGHKQCLNYLEKELKKYAPKVTRQDFFYPLPGVGTTMRGSNLIAEFFPEKKDRILLCAHWDTRPWADMDPDSKNHQQPVMGANDGASGVAILLEIANSLKQQPACYGVDLVLFDAEDAGLYRNNETWALGSKEYANSLTRQELPRFGILLDLVGDKNLNIHKEVNSQLNAPDLVEYVWNLADELGVVEFYRDVRYQVHDDHINLLNIGVPCIDIIDFDYPAWHTIKDVPENCSAESLGKVGRVVLEILYRGGY